MIGKKILGIRPFRGVSKSGTHVLKGVLTVPLVGLRMPLERWFRGISRLNFYEPPDSHN